MRRLAEAETFGATFWIGHLQIVCAVDACVARGTVYIFLAVARLIDWIANFVCCAFNAASALLTMRERKESMSTFIARTTFDVAQAITRSIIQVTLQIITDNAQWVAITRFTTEVLIESVRIGFALLTFFADYVRCTDASTCLFLTQRFRWAIAWFAIGEAKVSGTTSVTLASDDVRFALALTAKWIAFE